MRGVEREALAITRGAVQNDDSRLAGDTPFHREPGGQRERSTAAFPLSIVGEIKLKEYAMELGTFSISLTVKNIKASREFYEKLAFHAFAGDESQNWLILKNGEHAIGLFQGMFEKTS